MSPSCRATQTGDQMLCPCGLAWDVTDPEPPDCPEEEFDLPAVDGLEESAGRLVNRTKDLGRTVSAKLIEACSSGADHAPYDLHRNYDNLLAENARIMRIIAQIKTVCVPYGGPLSQRVKQLTMEADTHGN